MTRNGLVLVLVFSLAPFIFAQDVPLRLNLDHKVNQMKKSFLIVIQAEMHDF